MALARLAFATRAPGVHYSLIFSLPKSIGFYRRFGYEESSAWTAEGGKEYPLGILRYSSEVLSAVRETLEKRNLLIDPRIPVAKNTGLDALITEMEDGSHRVKLIEKVSTSAATN